MQLPLFSGNLSEWSAFINLYDSVIHNHPSLSPVQKLQYLRSHLSGEPFQLIASYAIDDSSYLPSYKCLTNRYYNKRRTLNFYLSQILNYKYVPGKNQLSQFLACHTNAVGAILDFNKKEPCLDYVLFHLAYQALSNNDKKDLDSRLDHDSLPTTKELFEFARQRSQSYELMVDLKASFESPSLTFHSGFKKSSNTSLVSTSKSASKPHSKEPSSASQSKPKRFGCFYCLNTDHRIYTCEKFSNLSIPERKQVAVEKKCCLNCLGFHKQECKSSISCKFCQSKHNSLLCPSGLPGDSSSATVNCHTSASLSLASSAGTHSVLFSTLNVFVADSLGKFHKLRCVLDSCSDITVITSSCVNRLGLQPVPCSQRISGLGLDAFVSNKQVTCVHIPYKSGGHK